MVHAGSRRTTRAADKQPAINAGRQQSSLQGRQGCHSTAREGPQRPFSPTPPPWAGTPPVHAAPSPALGTRSPPVPLPHRPGPTHAACAARRASICRCFCCWSPVRAGTAAGPPEAALPPPPLARGNSQFMAAAATTTPPSSLPPRDVTPRASSPSAGRRRREARR